MNPELVKFKAEHIIDMVDVTDTIARQAVSAEANAKNGGMAWSAMLGEKCIGCAIVFDEGTKVSIWVTTTPTLIGHKIWFHRTARQLYKRVKEYAAAKKLPIQILCDVSNPRALKWAWSFGFKCTPLTILEVQC